MDVVYNPASPPGFQAPPGVPNLSYPSYALGKSAIPFIGLSSGSVAANGVISGITALPFIYPNAYCWFPANALATVKAAGWYYCTFSGTAAGIAFLDTYTAGVPVIPAAPTPVVDGKGAFVGDTGEEFAPIITVPANALGANGALRLHSLWSFTNSAGNKTPRARWSGQAGQSILTAPFAAHLNVSFLSLLSNAGATNVQRGSSQYSTGSTSAGTQDVQTAVDTTAATNIALSLQRAAAADNLILESFVAELMYGA